MTPNEFEKVYDEYAQAIFRYCVLRVFDRERARDLMQETFTKTWEYIAKGNSIDHIKSFLYRVAHNVVVNEIRRPLKTQSLDTMLDEQSFDIGTQEHEQISTDAQARELIERMSKMKEEDAELLTLRYVSDLSIQEISKLLDQSQNTISVRIHRATERLRELYLDTNNEPN